MAPSEIRQRKGPVVEARCAVELVDVERRARPLAEVLHGRFGSDADLTVGADPIVWSGHLFGLDPGLVPVADPQGDVGPLVDVGDRALELDVDGFAELRLDDVHRRSVDLLVVESGVGRVVDTLQGDLVEGVKRVVGSEQRRVPEVHPSDAMHAGLVGEPVIRVGRLRNDEIRRVAHIERFRYLEQHLGLDAVDGTHLFVAMILQLHFEMGHLLASARVSRHHPEPLKALAELIRQKRGVDLSPGKRLFTFGPRFLRLRGGNQPGQIFSRAGAEQRAGERRDE